MLGISDLIIDTQKVKHLKLNKSDQEKLTDGQKKEEIRQILLKNMKKNIHNDISKKRI